MINLNNEFLSILQDLKSNNYDYETLSQALEQERQNRNRRPVVIALCRVLDGSDKLDSKSILRAVKAAETRKRRRFVNKQYYTNPIWMWDEIRKVYPDYTQEMLAKDLYKPKRKKRSLAPSERESFRTRQIIKLYDAYKDGHDKFSQNKIAGMIANHLNNYGSRLYYTIDKGTKSMTYSFRPKESESNIKKFLTRIPQCKTIEEVNKVFYSIIAPKFGE